MLTNAGLARHLKVVWPLSLSGQMPLPIANKIRRRTFAHREAGSAERKLVRGKKRPGVETDRSEYGDFADKSGEEAGRSGPTNFYTTSGYRLHCYLV